jgi:hypothetical protein
MLPLRELALDSHAYRQQPSMPRPQFSHLDNEGVKGLVDSICNRMRSGEQQVSMCAAPARMWLPCSSCSTALFELSNLHGPSAPCVLLSL